MKTATKNLKENQLKNWAGLPECPRGELLKLMQPIPYKAHGSRYGACGIRIDGSPEFIDAVLSRVKDLLAGEGITTRLELARHEVDGSSFGKAYDNAAPHAEVCYVRLHQRGSEGAMLQMYTANARYRCQQREQLELAAQ